MKKYKVEFTHLDGKKEIIEFTTGEIGKTIHEYCRNRQITKHEVLDESAQNSKQMLFG